ncbi:MAG: methyltransferase domain-containing protein [Candidatus Dojkabacteria bacterium]|nr:methyltransferase domain-containing protein [Candidatus Dojkabacteria bacterium]
MLNFIMNSFDFPIRYLYCHSNFFRKIIKISSKRRYLSHGSAININWKLLSDWLKKYRFEIKGKKILEIGPGTSMFNCYKFLIKGAHKVYLLDKFPRINQNDEDFKKERKNFCQANNIEEDSLKKLVKDRTIFLNKDIKEITLKDIDFIFSISVLEHVKDIDSFIKNTYKILKRTGYIYHSVDLKDHYNFGNSFLFYKYSKKIWDKYCVREGVSYTNRIRYDEFLSKFGEYGFQIVENDKDTVDMNKGSKIDSHFRKMDNLNVSYFRVWLRKND